MSDLELLHPLVKEALANVSAGYEVLECDPDLADTAAFCEAYGFTTQESANTILVVGKSDPPTFVACVVLADTKLDVNKAVSKKLGIKRCSFASGDQTVDLTGMMIGGVTAPGLPAGMALWVDSAVMAMDRIVLGGGNRSSKLICAPALLTELPNFEVVEGLALPKSW